MLKEDWRKTERQSLQDLLNAGIVGVMEEEESSMTHNTRT